MIIGGHRCGTTSLYNYLIEADVCRPGLCKEPGFFSNRKGRTLEWYEKGLKMNGSQPGVIDATVAYLLSEKTPQRVYNYNRDIKPIALLRNPVDRTWSAYWQYPLRRLLKTPLYISFDEFKNLKNVADYRAIITKELQGIPSMPDNRMFLHNGIYVHGLSRWKKLFPEMLVIRSEDMFANPKKVFKNVLDYLEVDAERMPEFKPHYSCSRGRQPEDLQQLLYAFFEHYNELLFEKFGIDVSGRI